MKVHDNRVSAFIVAKNLDLFGKRCWAYSLLVRVGDFESWYWGVKNNEDQWVDMQMLGLRRLLRAMANHDPDYKYKVDVIARSPYLENRLGTAAKWKRDLDRGLQVPAHWNRDAWIETSLLWDIYRGGLREGISGEEIASLALAEERLNELYCSLHSPLKTYESYKDSPGDLVLPI